jgi:protein-tyrosine phosphatase
VNAPALLIVCLGNICRSPVVAEVLRTRFAQAGCPLRVDSCGTGDWHAGKPADARMIEAARMAGYDLSAHRARQLEVGDFARFDGVLAMDRSNLTDLGARCPAHLRERVGLFLSAAGLDDLAEVPDPYHGDAGDFRHVIALAERGAQGLLGRYRRA